MHLESNSSPPEQHHLVNPWVHTVLCQQSVTPFHNTHIEINHHGSCSVVNYRCHRLLHRHLHPSCKAYPLRHLARIARITNIFSQLAVFLKRGCGADLLINIGLTILGWIPGLIHAWWIIRYGHPLLTGSDKDGLLTWFKCSKHERPAVAHG